MPPKKGREADAKSVTSKKNEAAKSIKSNDAKSVKSAKSATGNTKGILKNANPIKRSTESVGRAGDLRKQRDEFAAAVEKERRLQEEDVRGLLEKIKFYRKENEKLMKRQEVQFGMTLDSYNHVKQELTSARQMNDELLKDMERKKVECDKLQQEYDKAVERVKAAMAETAELQRQRRLLDKDETRIEDNENRIEHLRQANKDLRRVLLRNKIDPNADATKIQDILQAKAEESPIKFPYMPRSRFPKIVDKKSLMSFRSNDDLESLPAVIPPRKGILRRSQSLNPESTEYISAKNFLRRRNSDARPLTKIVQVFV